MVIDGQLLDALREESWEFRTLELRHRQQEEELAVLLRHRSLTPPEELHKKELQKQKLATKDRMTALIHDRIAHPPSRTRSASRSTAPGTP